VLCIVFAASTYFLASRHIRNSRQIAAEERFRKAAGSLASGRISREDSTGALFSESGDFRFVLTLDPELQRIAEELLERYDPVLGAFILIEPDTGAIMAMAAHSRKRNDLPLYDRYQTCRDPMLRDGSQPMASIAKLITASAAIESNIAGPGDTFTCTGSYKTKDGTVSDHSGSGHGRITMGRALATSCNPTFARLGVTVGRKNLLEYFNRFMFNRVIDFDMPVTESGASIAKTEYGLALAGAGFEGSWMSPLHAAAIAATIANGGVMMRPHIVLEMSRNGATAYRVRPKEMARPITRKTANALARMMSGTVNSPGGTAYRGFYANGRRITQGVSVAGKTGSLNGNSNLEHYYWFVGHATRDNRKFAFAAMIVNDNYWKIKAASYTGEFVKVAVKELE